MKKLLFSTAAMAMAVGFAGTASAEGYKIGISNTVQGNGWREEMVCAMKAQALVSGKVDALNIAHMVAGAVASAVANLLVTVDKALHHDLVDTQVVRFIRRGDITLIGVGAGQFLDIGR